MLDIKTINNLKDIGASLGKHLTEEQMEFAADLTKPVEGWSDPGTGKSFTVICGILNAQLYLNVPGRAINAMSYTNEATAELKARYDAACKRLGITPTARFNTFHSVCRQILKEAYPGMQIKGYIDYNLDLPNFAKSMADLGLPVNDMYLVRKILNTINALNNCMCYDEEHIRNSYEYKQISSSVTIEQLQSLRMSWFMLGLGTRTILQGDIPIYALFSLLSKKEIADKWKNMFRIMIIDEFQDMTLLHMWILQLICDNLVVVGDIKQQIYLFNGACTDIVEKYREMFPNAKKAQLTQSFRCKNEIADFATKLIVRNYNNVESFKGVGDGGQIHFIKTSDLDIASIVNNLKAEQDKGIYHMRSVMFLFRNNFSATPIAEAMYKAGLLCRVNKFQTVMQIPIYKDLCKIVDLACEPDNEEYLKYIVDIFPEFRNYRPERCPLINAIKKSGQNLYTTPYQFRDPASMRL